MTSRKDPLVRALSLVGFVLIWQLTAAALDRPGAAGPSLLPYPWAVLQSFYYHLTEEGLLYQLGITLYRVAVSFFVAMAIGSAIGILMGRSRQLDLVLDGLLVLALNIPALVTIILCYIWLGLTDVAAVVAVAANKIPNVVVTLREGARAVDRKLLEVAQAFAVSRWRTVTRVYLPQLYPFFMAAARSGLALIWKIVLVVEFLGRSDGVGFQLHTFFQFFDIASILAYTLAFAAVVLAIEALLMRPLERRLLGWRG